jgi:hypothetical protein
MFQNNRVDIGQLYELLDLHLSGGLRCGIFQFFGVDRNEPILFVFIALHYGMGGDNLILSVLIDACLAGSKREAAAGSVFLDTSVNRGSSFFTAWNG